MADDRSRKRSRRPPSARRSARPEAPKAHDQARGGVQGIWPGVGMFGLIGWAVAIPTLLGTLLGVWIDQHYPGVHSWTLSLLIVGLCLGCLNAVALGGQGRKSHPERTRRTRMNDVIAFPSVLLAGFFWAPFSSAGCGGRSERALPRAVRSCGFSAAPFCASAHRGGLFLLGRTRRLEENGDSACLAVSDRANRGQRSPA